MYTEVGAGAQDTGELRFTTLDPAVASEIK